MIPYANNPVREWFCTRTILYANDFERELYCTWMIMSANSFCHVGYLNKFTVNDFAECTTGCCLHNREEASFWSFSPAERWETDDSLRFSVFWIRRAMIHEWFFVFSVFWSHRATVKDWKITWLLGLSVPPSNNQRISYMIRSFANIIVANSVN